VGKHDALRQDIRNDKKPFRRHVAQLNRSSRLNLILGLVGERNDRGFLLKPLELPTNPGRQLFQETAFVLRRKPDQYRDPVAKQNGDASLANPGRERDRRKRFSLEANRIDPVTNMQCVCGNPCSRFGGNYFRFGHHTAPQETCLPRL
jgi:hypothetical protein